jgi:hypothetical protein
LKTKLFSQTVRQKYLNLDKLTEQLTATSLHIHSSYNTQNSQSQFGLSQSPSSALIVQKRKVNRLVKKTPRPSFQEPTNGPHPDPAAYGPDRNIFIPL